MGKFLIQMLRCVPPVFWFVVPATLLCSCSSVRLHLNQDEVAELRSASTTIIYVEPSQPLYVYAPGLEDDPGTPDDNSIGYGVAFGLVAFLAAETVHSRQMQEYDAFMKSFSPYSTVINKLPISAQLLEASRDALGRVPWYQHAEWKVVPSSNDDYFYHKMVELTDTQAVVFISPLVMIRNDAEVVRIDYRINIFIKNPNNKYDLHRFGSQMIAFQKEIYPGNQSPSNRLEDAFNDLSIDQRLNDIFSNKGALFRQTMSSIFAVLRPRLTFYFTDMSGSDRSLHRGD